MTGGIMTTKIFMSGNSQAVRIPKEFQLEGTEVEIIKRGNELILRPIEEESAAVIYDILVGFKGPIERIYDVDQERDVFRED
jgi:antitoxin VapB